jgi:NAD(P)-dependent dehydrogenase (short-subunit alcohol dehydrogenase family)
MSQAYLSELFSLDDRVAIVTGGTGVLGGAMARGLGRAGAKVAVLGRRQAQAEAIAAEICNEGDQAIAVPADVLVREQLESVSKTVLDHWGKIDILVNAAGGTTPQATVPPDKTIFDMPLDAMDYVLELNLKGTVLPCQVFGEVLAKQRRGCIVNISSMNAQRALTRAVAYSAAKAAVENFTRWLAVELALKFGSGLRVNAIAPGFFLGEQNRALLVNPDSTLTPRGQTIVNKTPAGRFGEPEELISTLIWLCGDGARFVNGTVAMVDGGFNAFSGV